MNENQDNIFYAYKIISKHPAFTFSEFFYKEDEFNENNFLNLVKKTLKNNKSNNYYIHIPFCRSLCNYCYCFKIQNQDDIFHFKYINYLDKELAIYYKLNWNKKLTYNSLNIWWWTPNIFSDDNFILFFNILNKYFDLNKKDKLINIDLNISFLSNKKLLTIKKYCSRVSIWIQTFNKKLLLESNRFFDKENFYNSYFRYFNINWIKINVDLMIWLKNQTLEDIDYTIKKIIFLKVDNVSLNYFHKKDWLKYDFDEKWIELIIETKSKWDKIIIKYNLSQNKQLDIESRKNNIIWIWVWAVGNIFGKVWFYRYNFDNYFNKIDNGILWFDKYIIIDTYLETVSYFLEKIFCRVKKIEIINIYWNKNLDKIKTKLNKLFINWFLKEDNEHIYSTVSDREIFPILVESLLGKYIKNWYFWNLTDNYSESENVYENYNFFFDHSGTYIDQLE